MPKLIEAFRENAIVYIAILVAIGVTAGAFTLDDVSGFFGTVAAAVVIVGGFIGRHFVSPATGEAAAKRENAVVAETLSRVGSGEIDPEMWGA